MPPHQDPSRRQKADVVSIFGGRLACECVDPGSVSSEGPRSPLSPLSREDGEHTRQNYFSGFCLKSG